MKPERFLKKAKDESEEIIKELRGLQTKSAKEKKQRN